MNFKHNTKVLIKSIKLSVVALLFTQSFSTVYATDTVVLSDCKVVNENNSDDELYLTLTYSEAVRKARFTISDSEGLLYQPAQAVGFVEPEEVIEEDVISFHDNLENEYQSIGGDESNGEFSIVTGSMGMVIVNITRSFTLNPDNLELIYSVRTRTTVNYDTDNSIIEETVYEGACTRPLSVPRG